MRLRGLRVVGIVAIALVGGCSTVSDSKLARRTAASLGVQPEDVQISNRQGSEGSTTFIATVKGKRYACAFGGGGVLSMGFSTPPNCNLALDQN